MRKHHSPRLIKHGIAAMVVAMLAGFGLIFSMIGAISFSPLPIFIHWEIPGSPQDWRILHVGTMMNGLMGVVLGVAMRSFALTDRGAATVAWGTIITIWGNFGFYLFKMFAPNHGLTLQGNSLGEANWAGAAAFLPGLAAVIALLVALVVLLRAKPAV